MIAMMTTDELKEQMAAHAHGRVPRELRRQQVLAEARRLFTERGYHAASMDELARRMGVSKPVVYDLASSKQQLFTDVMATVGAELALCLTSAVSAERDLGRKLNAGILAFLNFVADNRDQWSALLSSLSAAPASAELTALRRQQVLLVARLISERAGAGAEPPALVEALAQAINGAVESTALWWSDHPELSADTLADLLTGLLSAGLLALSSGAGDPGAR
jgi:AcrR family transcriptional regulator